MIRAVLLRYHEIALKGANRGWFEDRLAINAKKLLQRALGPEAKVTYSLTRGRVIIYTEWNDSVSETLGRVFGVTSFSPMRTVPTSLEPIVQAALEEFKLYLDKNPAPLSFAVRTKRSQKALPETSMEIDRAIGTAIQAEFPAIPVELVKPDFILGVEINFEESYISTHRVEGLGGLPVGTSGHLLTMISGGLDSPVAAIHALKRGANSSFLHFYGAPFVGPEVLEKVEDLVRIVNRYQPDPGKLFVIPFGKIQEKIALATNPKMRTILYRRMMVRIANAVAERIDAKALVTGESLGQVASQTLDNLATVDATSTIPILRPLITFDKDEIIETAKRWGTYELSIQPGVDCCTLFADRHPTLRSSTGLLEEQEARFSVDEMVAEALAGVERSRPY